MGGPGFSECRGGRGWALRLCSSEHISPRDTVRQVPARREGIPIRTGLLWPVLITPPWARYGVWPRGFPRRCGGHVCLVFDSLLDALGHAWWAYPLILILCTFDAIIPAVPSETALLT